MALNSKCGICLFRNDLRIHDNETLSVANQKSDFLIPLYCFDPRHFKGTYHFGFPKTGSHRADFLISSTQDLRSSIQSLGSKLIVRQGKPEQVIQELIHNLNLQNVTVFLQDEPMDEEKKVENAIRTQCKVTIENLWGQTLYHVEDLPFQFKHLPDVYTEFRKRVENRAAIRKCFPTPSSLKPLPQDIDEGRIPSLTDLGLSVPEKNTHSAFPFPGGESSGLQRLHDYLWGTDNVSSYKETRNGMIGSDYSTKFSPWLAHGCISPRKIYWEIKKYEKERTSNQSTYWVIFELLWRDYFHYVGLKFGNRLFYPGGLKGGDVMWRTDKEQFNAWRECCQLSDQRSQTGLETGSRVGDYVRLWVPELEGVKSGKVHCVWTLSPSVLQAGGVTLSQSYPSPIVMAPEWSRHVNRPGSSGGGRGKGGASGSSRGRGQGSASHRGQGSRPPYPGQKRGIDFYFSGPSQK
ncbi:cryptochrome DASH-like [Elysia marginata]|uniref:Cryptochrome DASH n=1 Tax=Elysia marginata TaxID=1093978 RepID=A0AAV4FU60_9GAST|nr:cryptochrome DASH-like [Elysia marginata]